MEQAWQSTWHGDSVCQGSSSRQSVTSVAPGCEASDDWRGEAGPTAEPATLPTLGSFEPGTHRKGQEREVTQAFYLLQNSAAVWSEGIMLSQSP